MKPDLCFVTPPVMRPLALMTLLVLLGCTSAPPPVVPPSPPPSDGIAVVGCNNAIAHNPSPTQGPVILNAVALPSIVLQAGLTEDGKYFAKHGLEVLTGKTVDLIVEGDDIGYATIGWNSESRSHVRFPGCRADLNPPDWAVYAGGYTVDEPRCVTLLVRVNGKAAKVPIAVGKPCQ